MPVFTISFCALIIVIYIIDTFIAVPDKDSLTPKEKYFTGHNKGYINRALHLSDEKIKRGELWRLLSSALLHVGTPHIITNTAAMILVGYAVESELGTVKTIICYLCSALISGLFMSFVYKLHEGEGASPGIFGLIAVFIILSIKHGTVMFSGLPVFALVILALYTITGIITQKATLCEHASGFAGGLAAGMIFVHIMN